MTERERLVELIERAEEKFAKYILHSVHDDNKEIPKREEMIADELLSNCVVVLPCKVGDTVYVVDFLPEDQWGCVGTIIVDKIILNNGKIFIVGSRGEGEFEFGKIVFSIKEEAEKALEEIST